MADPLQAYESGVLSRGQVASSLPALSDPPGRYFARAYTRLSWDGTCGLGQAGWRWPGFRRSKRLDGRRQPIDTRLMEHLGGCHCGYIRVRVRLTTPLAGMTVRSCACSFCRSHGTRTVSDPAGHAELRASDWSLVAKYRFGSRTADYLLCRRCGVYVGAVCETPSGARAVINTLCLSDRAAFVQEPARTDHNGETVEERLARREANWMPVVLRDGGAG